MPLKNVDEILVLSPMQRLMLMHSLTATGSRALSNQFRYRLTGALDPERLRLAWQSLVIRHAALRTCFLWDDLKEPVQVVRSEVRLPFAYEDLSALTQVERDRRLQELYRDDRRQEIDLRKAPLMRVILARLSDDEFAMIWTRHHLILDRWCVDLIFDELFHAYEHGGSLDDAPLPDAGHFRDYIQWLEHQDRQDAEAYWRDLLNGLEQPTLLFDHSAPSPPGPVEGLTSATETVDQDEYRGLKQFAKQGRVSLASVLQSALGLTLSDQTGSRDLVFGLTVGGRPADVPSIEATMGSFINNVPVRLQLEPDKPLLEWVKAIHASQARRFAYEYVSPVDIHRCSGLPAKLPLFDILALLHSPATEIRQGPGFELEQLESPFDSPYPLTLSLAETHGQLDLVGAYDPARASPDTVQRMLAVSKTVLHKVVAAPTSRLDQLIAFRQHDAAAHVQPTGSEDRPRSSHVHEASEISASAAVLSDIWGRTLGLDYVGIDDDFFALGGSSIQAAIAFTEMERHFGKALTLSTLFTAGSIRALLDVLEQPLARTSSLVEIQPHGTRPRLFVVPGIGGNVVGLNDLARALGPDQPFYGLQSKGLDGQDGPLTRVEDIAADYIAEMTPMLEEPYVICGICWGASVAFDMARQLRAGGRSPALLLVLDPVYHELPSVPVPSQHGAIATLLFVRHRLKLYVADTRKLEKGQRLDWVRSKAALLYSKLRKGGLFEDNVTEISQRRVSAANLAAQINYRPVAYEGSAGVFITADRDIDEGSDPRFKWLKFVPQDTPFSYVPGATTGEAMSGHNVVILAREFRKQVDNAMADDASSD